MEEHRAMSAAAFLISGSSKNPHSQSWHCVPYFHIEQKALPKFMVLFWQWEDFCTSFLIECDVGSSEKLPVQQTLILPGPGQCSLFWKWCRGFQWGFFHDDIGRQLRPMNQKYKVFGLNFHSIPFSSLTVYTTVWVCQPFCLGPAQPATPAL